MTFIEMLLVWLLATSTPVMPTSVPTQAPPPPTSQSTSAQGTSTGAAAGTSAKKITECAPIAPRRISNGF